MTDTAYLKWFHAVGMYTLAEWSLVPQECGVPWRDWYDEGLSAEAAFARAQQEHERDRQMTVEHTKTPWRVELGGRTGQVHAGTHKWLIGIDEESVVNAEFIVRAVNAHDDLVAACEMAGRALAAILGDKTLWESESRMRKVRGILRAALAKAGKDTKR